MIVDKIENRHFYRLPTPLAEALEYFASHDLEKMEEGKYSLPNGMAMKLDDYIPEKEDGLYEGHEAITHLRYIVHGCECLGYANKAEMTYVETVREDKAVYQGGGGVIRVPAGTFVVLYPQDCHLLKLKAGEGIPVRKASVSLKGEVKIP